MLFVATIRTAGVAICGRRSSETGRSKRDSPCATLPRHRGPACFPTQRRLQMLSVRIAATFSPPGRQERMEDIE